MNKLFRFKQVMIIDDDDVCRFLIERMFGKHHFAQEVISCGSAVDALKYLSVLRPKPSFPEIIFLDINMPEMDGFEFLEEFDRLNGAIEIHSPIIMLTSSENPEDLKRAQENKYVSAYFTKPLTDQKLESISTTFCPAKN